MGTPTLNRFYTFIAPSRQQADGAVDGAADRGTWREVTLSSGRFITVGGFTAFRKAASLRLGASVTVAACTTSPDHVHIAPASADGWDTGAAPPVSPTQPQQRRGKMLRPTASGHCTVVVAVRAIESLRLPAQLLR